MLNSWNIDNAIIEEAFIDNKLDNYYKLTKHIKNSKKRDIIKCFGKLKIDSTYIWFQT